MHDGDEREDRKIDDTQVARSVDLPNPTSVNVSGSMLQSFQWTPWTCLETGIDDTALVLREHRARPTRV